MKVIQRSGSRGHGTGHSGNRWIFWAYGACAGCAIVLAGRLFFPLWNVVTPRPSTVAHLLQNTFLDFIGPWVPLVLLYVPDMVLLFVVGVCTGFRSRRNWLRVVTSCVGAYGLFSLATGGGVWRRAFEAFLALDPAEFRYTALCVGIVSPAYMGGLIPTVLRKAESKPGMCARCGYPLHGLPSLVCPECGTAFSRTEARTGSATVSRTSNDLRSERAHVPPSYLRNGRLALLVRVCALAGLVLLYYGLAWMPLRVALRDFIAWSARLAGYSPVLSVYDGSPALSIGDRTFFYTAECTYIDLLFIVAPFVWVCEANLRRNCLRLMVAATIILGGNMVRTWVAVYFNLIGTDWFFTHDLPNYIICCSAVTVVVIHALRHDLGASRTSKPRASPAVPMGVRMGDDDA